MKIELSPIAFVKNSRSEIKDDEWGNVISEIHFIDDIPENTLIGMEEFSHFEIVFYMNKVKDEKAIPQYRHPRNNKSLPKVGTFAQRNKSRPNKIGLTTVSFLERKKNILKVKGLDAIDGTPILDIKPVMQEFEPKGEIRQPNWSREIMANYWSKK